ncbi:hypothetical protein [Caballeronia zhejiangensis]|uniref:Uncharacterized protein n=1 Tax=Caballeronia zhejiangensis TaxID=871203 RepID=A0A656QAG3_9BURK|nr:hypothetical protein [Caballeronia zhejiangensis]KDR25959.1 hypothetical protein BG60_26455 [Caballeronia zhejiangensis]
MTQLQSKFVTGQKTVIAPCAAGDVVAQTFYIDLAQALALNDVIELAVLPEYSRIVDATLDVDKLDTNGAPAIVMDIGLMSGKVGVLDNARTVGNELFAADVTAKNGGFTRLSKNAALRIAETDQARSIGVKVTTAPATGAPTGRVALTLFIVG